MKSITDIKSRPAEAELAKILELSPLTVENLGSYLSSLHPKDRRYALGYAIRRIALSVGAPGGPVRPV